MHGIVHKTLKEYVVERTDEETWATIVDRADIEPTLYLPISYYDDDEIDAILATVSEMAIQDRRAIERGFGQTLAPELLQTFNAHINADWGLEGVLTSLETIYQNLGRSADEMSLPEISCTPEPADDAVVVTYRTHRDHHYCGLAHGILEGVVAAFDGDASITKTACVDDTDSDACRYRVDLG